MSQHAIILITCDELKRDTLSYYGNKAIATPNIDSIAKNGAVFDECYTVSPLCLPARCSILTGLYPHRSGAYSNFRDCPLNPDVDNLFTLLKSADYHTSLIGKCHFAPVKYDMARPDKTLPYDGFKEYYMSLGLDHLDLQDDKNVSLWFYDDYSKELEEKGLLSEYRRRNWDKDNAGIYEFPGPAGMHPDAWVGRKAAEHIEQATEDKPFFTWVSFSGPHYFFDAPREYIDRVNTEALTPRIYSDTEFDDESRIHYTSYHGGGGIDGCQKAPGLGCKNYSDSDLARLREKVIGHLMATVLG